MREALHYGLQHVELPDSPPITHSCCGGTILLLSTETAKFLASYLVDEARRMGCLHFSPKCGVMDAIREACARCHLLGLSSHIFIPTGVLVQSHLCRSFTRPFTH